jgi:GNAT superfamily N-acetyltransferase
VTALADTARRTIAEHETLVLSDRDRAAFFDALINPPEPSERLIRSPGAPAPGCVLIMTAHADGQRRWPHHDREGFSCGIDSLDRYLRRQAGQDMRRRSAGVFVLAERANPGVVLGYYTLSQANIAQGDIPAAAARKHVPRYPLVAATLIGQLAVSQARQGERLGAILIADAVERVWATAATAGSSILVVDAINDRAAAFYEGNGFVRLPDSQRLVLPMHIQRLVER